MDTNSPPETKKAYLWGVGGGKDTGAERWTSEQQFRDGGKE